MQASACAQVVWKCLHGPWWSSSCFALSIRPFLHLSSFLPESGRTSNLGRVYIGSLVSLTYYGIVYLYYVYVSCTCKRKIFPFGTVRKDSTYICVQIYPPYASLGIKELGNWCFDYLIYIIQKSRVDLDCYIDVYKCFIGIWGNWMGGWIGNLLIFPIKIIEQYGPTTWKLLCNILAEKDWIQMRNAGLSSLSTCMHV